MHKFFFLGLVAAMVLFTIPSTAHANLLGNPGFESPMGDNVDPAVWWGLRQYPASPDVTMKTSTTQQHSGAQSGRITITGPGTPPNTNLWAGWGQQFTVGPGVPIFTSAWIKGTDDVGATAKLQLEFKDINGIEINRTFATAPDGTFNWMQLTRDVTTPTGTASVLVNLLVERSSGSAHGEYYWDDAYADTVPIPEPTSLLLLGSGLVGMFVAARRKK